MQASLTISVSLDSRSLPMSSRTRQIRSEIPTRRRGLWRSLVDTFFFPMLSSVALATCVLNVFGTALVQDTIPFVVNG